MVTVPVFNNGEHIGYFVVPPDNPKQVNYVDRTFDYRDGGYHLASRPFLVDKLYKSKEEIVNELR